MTTLPLSPEVEEFERTIDWATEWVRRQMPDVCRVHSRIVQWKRRLYGDELADEQAALREPHGVAVAEVMRLYAQHNHRPLSVREHGPKIREAVRRSDAQVLAGYKLLYAKREREEVASDASDH